MKRTIIFLIIIAFALTLTACEKEGTAEKAGKAFDKVLDSAKDKIDKATK